ncbi:CDP-glycerol glycerophosphotransferase family protein [Paraclostridium bifermentans]
MKQHILNLIIKLVNFIIPKKNNKILFRSEPDFSDNAKALYNYILENYRDSYSLVWMVKDENILSKLKEKNINVYKRNSIRGLLEFCTSKYIVGTHAQLANLKNYNQKYINLWHGMPLKNIGFLENEEKVGSKYLNLEKKKFDQMDYIIATSKTMRLAMASVFYSDIRNVFITGQPRNDFLFQEKKYDIISKCLDNIDLQSYEKIIMYIPTFRMGLGKKDGNLAFYNMLNLEKYDENDLNIFLNKNNYLLLIKFHPFEEAIFKKESFTNIKLIDSKKLSEELITLNEILNISDMMITDYSSVYFDYLLTKKPILFVNTDEKDYIENRGFMFDNPEFWRPGPKVKSIKMLTDEIQRLFQDTNYYEKEREIIQSLVNEYKDGEYSKKVYDMIFN